MKTIFYQKEGEAQAFSNFPVKINNSNAKIEKLEITEEEENAIMNSKKQVTLGEDKKLKITDKPLTEKELQKKERDNRLKELQAKIEAGTATQEEKDETLKLLLQKNI